MGGVGGQADCDGDGMVGEGCVGVFEGRGESGEGRVGLIGGCVEWPALPVDGAVVEVGDLGREGWVDVDGVKHQSQT